MANVVLPILAAVAGFAGTLYVISQRAESNPVAKRPDSMAPLAWMVKKLEWLQDIERWSRQRLGRYDRLIELLSEPERLRGVENDWRRYEIVDNIIKGGFKNAWAGQIERKDATALKPMVSTMLQDPKAISEMLKVIRAGRTRAEAWAKEGRASMDWARGLGPWIYMTPDQPMPKPPSPRVKDTKEALGAFQTAFDDVLQQIQELPEKDRKSARWRALDILQLV
jgi:hypothetical protein